MNFTSLLINKCDIQSKSMSVSGYEKTPTWSDVATNVPCRKGSINGNRVRIQDTQLRTNTDDEIFYFNPDVVIVRGNRIKFENDLYDVVKANKCQDSSKVHHIEVVTRLVDHA